MEVIGLPLARARNGRAVPSIFRLCFVPLPLK